MHRYVHEIRMFRVNGSVNITVMENINATPNGAAPRTKRANITTVIALHIGKWRPGQWQYAMIDTIATAMHCTTARATDRATGRDGATRDYGRNVAVTGAAGNVARVAAEYGRHFDAVYPAAKIAFQSPDVETCNPDALEWGPFINSFANGYVRTMADKMTVANTIVERPHAATMADGATMATETMTPSKPRAPRATARRNRPATDDAANVSTDDAA